MTYSVFLGTAQRDSSVHIRADDPLMQASRYRGKIKKKKLCPKKTLFTKQNLLKFPLPKCIRGMRADPRSIKEGVKLDI